MRACRRDGSRRLLASRSVRSTTISGRSRTSSLPCSTVKNERLLQWQAAMLAEPMPLSHRWERTCDYLDDNLSSGYVRVLQEMIAAGWSDSG